MDERAGKGVIVYAAIISQEGEKEGGEGAFKRQQAARPESPPPLDSYHSPSFEAVGQ